MPHYSILKKTLFFILILDSIQVYSQRPPEKFGRVVVDDFKISSSHIDSAAHAFFIFDFGTSDFEYADLKVNSLDSAHAKGFQLIFTRHFRIKFVDNKDFSRAKIEIPLYKSSNPDRILKLNAFTYNLVNGKVVKTKLKSSDVYSEELSDYWSIQKFEMPDVRQGSIIEVEYSIKSDYFYNLRPWYFQHEIPVLLSEYTVSIPEYFKYSMAEQGYLPISYEEDSRPKVLTINFHQKAEGVAVSEEKYSQTFDYRENIFHFKLENIPAIQDEEHLRSIKNYLSKIDFELRYTQFPNSEISTYTTSWDEMAIRLLGNDKFGLQINRDSHVYKVAENLLHTSVTEIDLLERAYNFMKEKMVWNGHTNLFVTSPLNLTFDKGIGNSADVNLNLLVLLRKLKFEANPIVLSTQENGLIPPSHATISNFNYVVVQVRIDGVTYLLDATDQDAQINILPIRCLNGKGLLVSGDGAALVDLMEVNSFYFMEAQHIVIDKTLRMQGSNELKLKGYASYAYRKDLHSPFKLGFKNGSETMEIANYVDYLPEKYDEDVVLTYDFIDIKAIQNSNEILFFPPAQEPYINENPFKSVQRDYPVEYNHTYYIQQSYTYSVPDNYTIDEMPKPSVFKLPDNSASYVYNILQHGNSIRLTIIFSVKKTVYLPDEYALLKKFYQLIIEKQKELVVLKKTL